jgi:hypothetical protein
MQLETRYDNFVRQTRFQVIESTDKFLYNIEMNLH